MANNSDEIDVWYVEPDPDARYTSIIFDDKDKAIDFAKSESVTLESTREWEGVFMLPSGI